MSWMTDTVRVKTLIKSLKHKFILDKSDCLLVFYLFRSSALWLGRTTRAVGGVLTWRGLALVNSSRTRVRRISRIKMILVFLMFSVISVVGMYVVMTTAPQKNERWLIIRRLQFLPLQLTKSYLKHYIKSFFFPLILETFSMTIKII